MIFPTDYANIVDSGLVIGDGPGPAEWAVIEVVVEEVREASEAVMETEEYTVVVMAIVDMVIAVETEEVLEVVEEATATGRDLDLPLPAQTSAAAAAAVADLETETRVEAHSGADLDFPVLP
jgi:hypothetical protein